MKNTSPITAIITTYKRPKCLQRAIASVLNQTYQNFQLYIYDDASNDGTREIVESFQQKDARIHYHCHDKNIGMMGNYQYAFSRVSSSFFSFLSDDDLLLPSFFETAMNGFRKSPEAGFFIGSSVFLSEKGKVVSVPISLWKKEGLLKPLETIKEMTRHFPPPTGILFRREVLDKVKVDTSNPVIWDLDFLLHTSAEFLAILSKKDVGIFFTHKGAFSSSQTSKTWEIGFEKMIHNFKDNSALSSEIKKEILNRISIYKKKYTQGFGIHYFRRKQFQEAYLSAKTFQKNYGKTFKNSAILLIGKTCHKLPFLFPLFYSAHCFKNAIKNRKLQSTYGHYAQFIYEKISN